MQVEFVNVTKSYGAFHAVKDLSLKIESGGLHFLLGPSGCGKTTTLRMLAGLEKVTSGQILFDGKDVTHQPAAERGIGMVFQNYALWPHMTVYKNVEYGLKLRKLEKDEVKRRIDEVLDFTQLSRFEDRLPGQLSGGQQQRVALARALAIRPNILLLDEPLSNLDAKLRLEMRENIVRIHRSTGITMVYVTHDQKEALSMGTHISVMHAGHLIQSNTPKSLYNKPETPFIANFIGETNFFDGAYEGAQDGAHLVKLDSGTVLKCGHMASQAKAGDRVQVSVRPEALQIRFSDSDQSRENNFNADLDSVVYLGESEQFMLKWDNQPCKANVFHTPDHSLKEGDSVQCTIAKDDLLVLSPEESLGAGT